MSSNHPQHDYRTFDPTFDSPYQNTAGYDAEREHAPRRRSGCCCFACCLGCFGFILLIILAIAALCYCFISGAAPLVVSEETTIITEPLKPDGTVDFHKAIQAMTEPDAPADQNGFRDVLRGFGQKVFESVDNEQYREMCKRLEIDPEAQPQWHDIVDESLDAVQVAAAKPQYFIPLVRQSEKDFVLLSQPFAVYAFHEKLSDALRQRAEILFSTKKSDKGWQDMFASLRLFRRVTVNQAWLKTLTPEDLSTPLLTPVSEVVATLEHWTPEQLEQAIKDLESLPDWQDHKTTLKMMQFTLLDLMSATNNLQERLPHETPEDVRKMLSIMQFFFSFDWNLVAIELNKHVQLYQDALEKSAANSLDELFDFLQVGEVRENPTRWNRERWEQQITYHYVGDDPALNPLLASGRSKVIGMVVGDLLVPWAAGEMFRLQLVEESRCQALRFALALELYHRENQKYPGSLDELGLQPMKSDMQLRYEKRGDGYCIHNRVFQMEKE
jgi:hypothetical protein